MSIKDASKKLHMSTRNIGRKLDDISNTDYERLDYHKNHYFDTYEVKIGSTYFDSTRSVVNEGLAKSTRRIRDRCRSKKWTDCKLLKKRSNDYPARE